MKIYRSIAREEVFEKFSHKIGECLMHYNQCSCTIETFISVARILNPEIVEIEGYILLKDFIFQGKDIDEEKYKRWIKLQKKNGISKKESERNRNSWSICGLINMSLAIENDVVYEQYIDILVYFWSQRVKELFPNRNIVIEVGEGIGGESGLAITLYEE